MKFISTRGKAPALGFADTMLAGLARDGGLYVPERLPQLAPAQIAALAGLPYEQLAARIMQPFTAADFTEDELAGCLSRAYQGFGHKARAPLSQLEPDHFLLELFHGPTLAFKDFAMQAIGQLFQTVLARSGRRITIVGATSGDTGSAAIEAFRGLANVDVFILFPKGRISEVQRRQMTTPAEANVHALAIDGDFDAAQARLKQMFNDAAFRDEVGLAGINSINFARVLAQVVYYFAAALALGAPARRVAFTVPTGNFGDVYAGHLARGMGLPIERLVIATNQNDILHRTLETGAQVKQGVRLSLSPSMDIQVASNFERALFEVLDRDAGAVRQLMAELDAGGFTLSQGAAARLRELFASGRASEEETLATMARIWRENGTLICPHTAVAVKVAEEQRPLLPQGVPMVTLATAHPAKFPEAVERATGQHPPLPARMADLFARPERVTEVPDDLAALQAEIRARRAA